MSTALETPDFHLTGLGLGSHFSPDLAHEARIGTPPPVPPGFEGIRTPGLEGLGQVALHSGRNSPALGFSGIGLGLDSPRKATPTIPPGFTAEHLSQPPSRTSSRTSMRISKLPDKDKIWPAVPNIPTSHATPGRTGTPLKEVAKVREREEHTTPTKISKRNKANKKLPSSGDGDNDDMKVAIPTTVETVSMPAKTKDVEPESLNLKKSPSPTFYEDSATHRKSAARVLAEKHAQNQHAAAQQVNPPLTAAQMLEQRHRKSEAERAASRPASRLASPVGSRAPSPTPDGKKKQGPGKLDIAAAITKATEGPSRSQSSTPLSASASLARPGAVIKTLPMTASPASSRTGTPAIGATDTPAKKVTAPRTLRVVATPTPKTEAPPNLPTPGHAGEKQEAKSVLPTFPSRQPSLASINMPGTPGSDHAGSSFISDNVSVTSTSFSRASSPPPGPVSTRVGSAPVRAKTKNQQKKDRQERARQIEEERLLALEAEKGGEGTKVDGIVQEAIVGRKKKQKKAAAPKQKVQQESQPTTPKIQSQQGTPAQSRPGTPKLAAIEQEPAATAMVTPTIVPEKLEEALPEPAKVEHAEPEPTPRSPSPPPAPVLTPQRIISELRQYSPLLSSSIDTLLRPLAQQSQHYKPSQPLSAHDLSIPRSLERNPDVNIKAVNLEYMWQNHSGLRYGGEDGRIWSRGCVTPGGAHIRHLEETWEERFISLENELRRRPEILRYWPELQGRAQEAVSQLLSSISTSPSSNSQNPNLKSLEDEFPRIDLVKLKRVLEEFERYGGRRDANAMEKAVEEGSKKGSFLVDTAGKYVNEFVLPTYGAPSVAGLATHSGNAPVGVGVGGVGATSAVAKLGPGAAPLVGENQQQMEGGAVQDMRAGLSVHEAEKMLSEAKKVLEEREAQLRKVVKRNRKLVGLTH
ncbi:hypothetical protein AAFC00_004388 [Neodothiora populina]|uniref:Uncharacterized protein n=1 Tax=Neodothiora populina TaxID=2781224 RepID=A0ABR3PJR8_9PEZI